MWKLRIARPDVIAGLILFIFSNYYWIEANRLPKSSLSGAVGADGFPKALALVLGALSLMLVLQALFREAAPPSIDSEARRRHMRAAGIWAIGAVAALILPWAGYPLTVAVLLFAVALYYHRPISLPLFLIAVVGGAVFWLLFVQLLGVPMPIGIWAEAF